MDIDLDRLWQYPWFDRALRVHYHLDPRRHIRYDQHTQSVYYIIRRSSARNNLPGRFACDAKTLDWLLDIERHGQVESAYVVLVEDWRAPPQCVWSSPARDLWARLERIVPYTSARDEESEYWWLNDEGVPQDAWLGPVLKQPPF